MIYFILQFAVNFFILYPIIYTILDFYPIREPHFLQLISYLKTHVEPLPAMAWPTIIVLTLLLLGITTFTTLRPFQWILCFSNGAGVPSDKEMHIMREIMNQLCQRTGKNPDSYHLYVEKSPYINAFALGRNNICVNSACFDELTTEEIAALIAHELGHLECNHTSYGLAIYALNIITHWILFLCSIIQSLCFALTRIPLLGILTLILGIMLSIYLLIAKFILSIPMRLVSAFTMQRQEYEADLYACKLGLGRPLYTGLEKIELQYNSIEEGFFDRLLSTHPSTEKRLKKISNYLHLGELELRIRS